LSKAHPPIGLPFFLNFFCTEPRLGQGRVLVINPLFKNSGETPPHLPPRVLRIISQYKMFGGYVLQQGGGNFCGHLGFEILQNFTEILRNFAEILQNFAEFRRILQKFCGLSQFCGHILAGNLYST
jgi:hypothetical protein